MKSILSSLFGSRRQPDAVPAPQDASLWVERGMQEVRAGQKDAALQSFEHALGLDPRCHPALFGRAALLQGRRDWDAALSAYDAALAVNDGDPVAHYNRATVLRELARPQEALAALDRAIALNPAFARALASRGVTLQSLQRLGEALADYDRALGIEPRDPATLNNRGVLLQKMARLPEALDSYERALSLNPAYAEAYFNRGTVQKELDDLAAAQASYERALALNPRYTDALVNLGGVLHDRGLLAEAIASCRRALDVDPGFAEAHYNLALVALKLGDYQLGWASYEWRWSAKSGPIFRENREFSVPLWLGRESLAGKTIMLYGEQGLGDSLQFCRYTGLVADLGAQVILEVPQPLVRLCTRLRGVARVIPYRSPCPPVEFRCPLLSLPLALGTTLTSVPAPIPYLSSNPDDVVAWQARLGAKRKPRVGLAWSGNRQGSNHRRHFALSELLPYLPPDFEYVCLQTEVLEADERTLAAHPQVRRFSGELRDFGDTAALADCLDLVISVDTSVAHLAGAMGRPAWVLLAPNADWRWLTARADSQWYPGMRLYRQDAPGNWAGVFDRVRADLVARDWRG